MNPRLPYFVACICLVAQTLLASGSSTPQAADAWVQAAVDQRIVAFEPASDGSFRAVSPTLETAVSARGEFAVELRSLKDGISLRLGAVNAVVRDASGNERALGGGTLPRARPEGAQDFSIEHGGMSGLAETWRVAAAGLRSDVSVDASIMGEASQPGDVLVLSWWLDAGDIRSLRIDGASVLALGADGAPALRVEGLGASGTNDAARDGARARTCA